MLGQIQNLLQESLDKMVVVQRSLTHEKRLAQVINGKTTSTSVTDFIRSYEGSNILPEGAIKRRADIEKTQRREENDRNRIRKESGNNRGSGDRGRGRGRRGRGNYDNGGDRPPYQNNPPPQAGPSGAQGDGGFRGGFANFNRGGYGGAKSNPCHKCHEQGSPGHKCGLNTPATK
jgi:hypothetical protein